MKRTTLIVTGLMMAIGPALVATATPVAALPSSMQQRLAALSVPFVPNAGQWDAQAAFAAHTFAGILFVTTDGQLVYRLPAKEAAARLRAPPDRQGSDARAVPPASGWVLAETLVDAHGQGIRAAPHGANPQAGKVSFAVGNDEAKHRDGLPGYEFVDLGNPYPGIAVELRATGNNVEKIFTVAPGRDPAAIRVRLAGAERLELADDGRLLAFTGNGPVVYTAPVAYQDDAAGTRSEVPVRYALDSAAGTYGFAVGAYDADRPLVIDPLLQSSYLGGSGFDTGYAMAIHPLTGEVYVAGNTQSANFPKVAGAEQSVKATGYDAFVTRFDAALTTRLQSTFLGGNSSDLAAAIAIHPVTGDVYVAGNTQSTDFPKTTGAEQPTHAVDSGQRDAFVTRLNAALTTRLQSTYLGGNGNDYGMALAVHPTTGDIYVAGATTSTDFPVVAGSAQPTHGSDLSSYDGFVTRLNAALTDIVQSTYLGGNGYETVNSIAIHPATGEIYAAGYTGSGDFPGMAGAQQTTPGGGTWDAFVSRLNATLTSIVQSTYLGGTGDDVGSAVAIHPSSGEVYVGGSTTSADFPAVAGSEQTTDPNNSAGFVTRLNSTLTTRLQSTLIGGDGNDTIIGVAIHPATGEVYVTGTTLSSNLPKATGGEQPSHAADSGVGDGFVTRLNASLTSRLQSTYLGGTGDDDPYALAIHPANGQIYVMGATASTDFPQVTGAEQTTLAGPQDVFVSRISSDLLAAGVYPDPFTFTPKFGVPVGSLQVAAPVQITGLAVPTTITSPGSSTYAQYCISSASGCACDVAPYTSSAGSISNNQWVCYRQFAPLVMPGLSEATLWIGSGFGKFFVTTGAGFSACSLDVDGNGAQDALTDGLMILRAMFGLTGTSVTNGAMGIGATRADWATLRAYLNGNCGANFVQ